MTITTNPGTPGNAFGAQADRYTLAAGGTLRLDAAHGLLANDVDPTGGRLQVVGVGLHEGVVRWGADGSLTFASRANQPSLQTFTYSVRDSAGTITSNTVTVQIENTAPVVRPETYRVHGPQTFTVPASAGLLANDSDAEGNLLMLTAQGDRWLNGARAQVTLDGGFRFSTSNTGTFELPYQVTDHFGGVTFGVATIEVYNAVPVVAVSDYWTHGSAIEITAASLLARASDADGDAMRIAGINFAGLADKGGARLLANGNVQFKPEHDFTGIAKFTYTVADGYGGSGTGTVQIHVGNAAPMVADEAYRVVTGTPLTLTNQGGVLANDRDPEGDSLRVVAFDTSTLSGTLTIRPDGSLAFAAEPGFVGKTRAGYTVDDGYGGRDTGEVTFEVMPNRPEPAGAAVELVGAATAGVTMSAEGIGLA